MRRRTVLAAVACSSVTSGCLGSGSLTGTAEFTITESPENLHERGDCDRKHVTASVTLSDPLDAPTDASAVVRYRDLDSPARRLVRFYRLRGSAVCCDGDNTRPFRRLMVASSEREDAYEETHEEAPSDVLVRVADSYHRIVRLTIYDQVWEP